MKVGMSLTTIQTPSVGVDEMVSVFSRCLQCCEAISEPAFFLRPVTTNIRGIQQQFNVGV
jgi:hypothetical protein